MSHGHARLLAPPRRECPPEPNEEWQWKSRSRKSNLRARKGEPLYVDRELEVVVGLPEALWGDEGPSPSPRTGRGLPGASQQVDWRRVVSEGVAGIAGELQDGGASGMEEQSSAGSDR